MQNHNLKRIVKICKNAILSPIGNLAECSWHVLAFGSWSDFMCCGCSGGISAMDTEGKIAINDGKLRGFMCALKSQQKVKRWVEKCHSLVDIVESKWNERTGQKTAPKRLRT